MYKHKNFGFIMGCEPQKKMEHTGSSPGNQDVHSHQTPKPALKIQAQERTATAETELNIDEISLRWCQFMG